MTARDAIEATLGFLSGRKTDYQFAFGSPAGQRVLMDLAPFCRAAETCGVPGDRDKTMILIGRNEVWLRIQQHLNLSQEDLFLLYSGQPPKKDQSNEAR